MPLSTEVGLCPGDIVLDGDPAATPSSPKRGSQQFSALLGPHILWPNGAHPMSATAEFFMAALRSRYGHYIFALWFFFYLLLLFYVLA